MFPKFDVAFEAPLLVGSPGESVDSPKLMWKRRWINAFKLYIGEWIRIEVGNAVIEVISRLFIN